MSFGWSAGDVIAGLQLLNQIRVALKDSGGSRSEYQDETAFLDNLSLTLRALGSVQPESLQPAVAEDISRHAKHIGKAVDGFLRDVQSRFGSNLGRFPTAMRRGVWGASASTFRKMQWAISTSKKVRALRDRISAELPSLQIILSQHIINICSQIPADIQCQMERVIKSTLDDHGQAHRSPPRDGGTKMSIEASVVEEHYIEHLGRALRDVEDRASNVIREGHCANAIEHGPVAVNHEDREKRVHFDSYFDQVSAILCRLEQLHTRFEACALQRTTPASSVSTLSAKDGGLSENVLEKPELLLQSVDQVLNGLFSLIITLAIIAGYSRLVMPLFTKVRLLHIEASVSNGLRLIDALGRVGVLPYGCGRTWSTVQKTLEVWFEGCPGQNLVRKGMYCLGDPQEPNRFFTEEAWSYYVQDGATIQMRMQGLL
ncbi:hypothetical protein N8I77_007170 [Diaporthe amygdali]|uniref:Ubiquitin-like domain-containing protein n=1 Tax=Phomopsis amygdali TaxID=1214568 RepID=A0AAD9W143_PHOAM|nr:hypothetical protein N8I77_007170 [Diaporthe amygdali]